MARLRVRAELAKAAGVVVPETAEGFYPCEVGDEAKQWMTDAAAAYAEEAAAAKARRRPRAARRRETARCGQVVGMTRLARSGRADGGRRLAADVIEGSAADLAREAYERVKRPTTPRSRPSAMRWRGWVGYM